MFKNLDPQDISKKPFKSFKNFTFDQNDSGSGVFIIKARSGSIANYDSGSDHATSVTTSGSVSTDYYALPTWHTINKMFYKDADKPYLTFGGNDPNKENRELNTSASILNVSRDIIGEQIKTGSVDLDVTIGGVTYTLYDDGDGNLYDNAHSASFAAFKSSSFDRSQGVLANGSGSEVGNVFYSQGLIILTDTGSYDGDITAFELKYQSTQTNYEYEYRVTAKPHEFNTTTNISVTPDRSGSITIKSGSVNVSNFFPPSILPTGQGTGSYATEYNAATESLAFVTGSDFHPFVTQIGLYTEDGELAAVGKVAKPIQLSNEISTTFVVRFDI